MKMKITIVALFFACLLLQSCAGGNSIVVEKNARFTVLTPECIRMEYSQTGNFVNNASLFAVNREISTDAFKHLTKNDTTIIETGNMRLYYYPDGQPFSEKNVRIVIKNNGQDINWVPGTKNSGNLGGTLRTVDQISGKTKLPDGLISTDGWALVDDSHRPLFEDNWVKERPEGTAADWYFFGYGRNYKAALKSLTAVAGKVPLPRKYAFGSWYSRYWPYSTEDYKNIVEEFNKNDFPLDIMVLDMDWHKDGWTGWSWNRKLLPDAENLLNWFHSKDLKVTMNLHPATGVAPHEDMYRDFSTAMKANPDLQQTIPFDASNRDYLNTLIKYCLVPHEKSGVDFWWLDWQQSEYTKGMKSLKNLEWLNHVLYTHSETDNLRGLSFSRWGGWGDHRYPIHFSGDAVAIWPMLEFEVPFTSTAGNVGCFFWSHDIGGHMGHFDQETNTRWVQFGALSAALRLHSTRDPNMDKRPWLFAPEFDKSQQIAFHLRSQLFPYIYSAAALACRESEPMISPMYMEYPEKDVAYKAPQQYLFGKSLLVAPIVSPGTGKSKLAFQNVWFPEGDWYNIFTNEKYGPANGFTSVWADIYEFPVFVKGGVPVPMQPYTSKMASEPLKNLVVRVYPGQDSKTGSAMLYEDDGISREYESGKYAETKLEYTRNKNNYQVTVYPAQGSYAGQLEKRSYTIEFAATQKAVEALVDGKTLRVEYDTVRQCNKVVIPEISIQQKISISLTAEEIDYNKLSEVIRQRRLGELLPKELIGKTTPEIWEYFKKQGSDTDINNIFSFLTGVSFRKNENSVEIVRDINAKSSTETKATIFKTLGSESSIPLNKAFDLSKGLPITIPFYSESEATQLGSTSIKVLQLAVSVNDSPLDFRTTIENRQSYIPSWYLAGPFPFDTAASIKKALYQPEKKLDITESYTGTDGKSIKWKIVKADRRGILNISQQYDIDNSVAYAACFIDSPIEQKVSFQINSDDGNQVFLNGQNISTADTYRGLTGETDKANGQLVKGRNTILVKVSQGGGDWALRMSIETQKPVNLVENN